MNQTMRYRAANNQELVEYLKRKGVIKSQRIFDVLSKVDRKKYVNNHNPYNDAYIDSPQNIGNGRTISAPHMHAVVLEILDKKLSEGSKVLTIRCSAGYLTVCIALLVGCEGTVVHVESDPDVQYKIKANIINDDPSLLISSRIQLILDDKLYGYLPQAPYDVIYIGAAVSEIPQEIIDQLAIDGLLLVPMIESKTDVDSQMLTLVKKNKFSAGITKQALVPVRFGILSNIPVSGRLKTKDNKSTPQDTIKVTKLQNNTPLIPKILEVPDSISPISIKNISETNINNEKLKSNYQKSEVKSQVVRDEQVNGIDIVKTNNNYQKSGVKSQIVRDEQDNGIDTMKEKFDSLEKKYSDLEDSFRKIHKTSLILKLSNQNKMCAIEKKYSYLDGEINILKNTFEHKMMEQFTFMKNINKQLELNLLKLNKRFINKNAIIDKNATIIERKLNKKIAKLKRLMEDKINDEGKLLMKELSVFKVSTEDKLAKEYAIFCEKMSGELERRDLLLQSKIKKEMLCLKKLQKTDLEHNNTVTKESSNELKKVQMNNQNTHYQLMFCAIITLHTVLAMSKIIF